MAPPVCIGGKLGYYRKTPGQADNKRTILEVLRKLSAVAESVEAAYGGGRGPSCQGEEGGCTSPQHPGLDVPVQLPDPCFGRGAPGAGGGGNGAASPDLGEAVPSVPLRGVLPISPSAFGSGAGAAAAGGDARPARGLPLVFSSAFECGNLRLAKLTRSDASAEPRPHYEFELELERDTRTGGNTQWFYFACSNLAPCSVTFNIVNFRKKRSLHEVGMQPHVCSLKTGGGWDAMACTSVSYGANGRWSGVGHSGVPLYTLSFKYDFAVPRDTVYFAGYTPYTFSMLHDFLNRLTSHPSTRPYVSHQILCNTLAGAPVPLLLITAGLPEECLGHGGSRLPTRIRERLLAEVRRKPVVAIIARQHPGEVVASWVVAGLVRFLVGPSMEAAVLRERFCFHIVPMVNVDGVVFGNSRCTYAGEDPNRCWHDPSPDDNPVVHQLRDYLSQAQQKSGVGFFLDIHGHSQKTAAFFYGNRPEEMRSVLFPKLASMATRDVDLGGCRFRFGKRHTQTARAVAFGHCGIFNSFTLETSLYAQRVPAPTALSSLPGGGPSGLAAEGSDAAQVLFVPRRAETIGQAVGQTLFAFFGFHLAMKASPYGDLAPKPLAGAAALADESLGPSAPARPAPSEEEDERLAPWLTYKVLRSTNADQVLADLESLGSTVFDVLHAAGQADTERDDPGSDSEGEGGMGSRDEPTSPTSPTSPTAQRPLSGAQLTCTGTGAGLCSGRPVTSPLRSGSSGRSGSTAGPGLRPLRRESNTPSMPSTAPRWSQPALSGSGDPEEHLAPARKGSDDNSSCSLPGPLFPLLGAAGSGEEACSAGLASGPGSTALGSGAPAGAGAIASVCSSSFSGIAAWPPPVRRNRCGGSGSLAGTSGVQCGTELPPASTAWRAAEEAHEPKPAEDGSAPGLECRTPPPLSPAIALVLARARQRPPSRKAMGMDSTGRQRTIGTCSINANFPAQNFTSPGIITRKLGAAREIPGPFCIHGNNPRKSASESALPRLAISASKLGMHRG